MKRVRQLLLISSSKVHGHEYLQHTRKEIESFCNSNQILRILFVPYAAKDHDAYTEKVATALRGFGYETTGIHTYGDKSEAIKNAQCIFVGGGNTFLLLKTLYELNLVELIRERVTNGDLHYMGSSAGTNVATKSIKTTNDMPIVFPPTFDAIGLVPFNINPHYLDADPNNKHQGETREDRLKEFHEQNVTPVLGLREGTALLVDGDRAQLVGEFNGRLFRQNEKPEEIQPNTDLSFLLQWTD
ncbi:putative alpha-aspartyl dipeptidase [Pseudolycoriella hygida]|uniref:dipeptidase E n=1 Tax=Pseudolycoriella hygida TaxID=35572 RepID=A0A9Q0RZ02_9DIPT|nr:putative alpha-aspartyl dipeptidase [Pseudolycoriella hygida]